VTLQKMARQKGVTASKHNTSERGERGCTTWPASFQSECSRGCLDYEERKGDSVCVCVTARVRGGAVRGGGDREQQVCRLSSG
jgi:hypothetical protein